jgi:hypothetical protein
VVLRFSVRCLPLCACEALSWQLDTLGTLLPGVSFAQLAWRAPNVLRLSRADAAACLTALRFALPPAIDLAQLVTRVPELLLCDCPGEVATAAQARVRHHVVSRSQERPRLTDNTAARPTRRTQARLRELFPGADVAAMVALEPGVLLTELSEGARRMRAEFAGSAAELSAYVSTPAGLHSLLRCQQAGDGDAEDVP